MTDPVSDELERRMSEPMPWRSALVAALLIHGAVAALVMLGPSGGRRALSLPRVQVRIAPALPSPPQAGGSRAPAREQLGTGQLEAHKPTPRPDQKQATKAPLAAKPAKPAAKSTSEARPSRSSEARPPTAVAGQHAEATGPPDGGTASRHDAAPGPAGAVGLGRGSGKAGTDEVFPYGYYLDRVLGMIESNWFRPPASAETRSRVLCRIDRTGRVLEVGLEEPSTSPAFDRAALRAVYAAAPFPPLPQGFRGSTLTLHLEFGPQ